MINKPKSHFRKASLRLTGLILALSSCCAPQSVSEVKKPEITQKVDFWHKSNPYNRIGLPAMPFKLKVRNPQQSKTTKESVGPQDYLGQVVVLKIWSEYCGFCRSEFPILDNIHQKYDDVTVLALDYLKSDNELLQPRYKKLTDSVHFPLLDNKGKVLFDYDVYKKGPKGLQVIVSGKKGEVKEEFSSDIARYIYGINGVPTTYIIDKGGIVREVHFGSRPQKNLEWTINKYR